MQVVTQTCGHAWCDRPEHQRSTAGLDTLHDVLRWASKDLVDPPGTRRCRYCSEPESSGHMADCWVGDAFASLERVRGVIEAARLCTKNATEHAWSTWQDDLKNLRRVLVVLDA